jgi:ribonuclease D
MQELYIDTPAQLQELCSRISGSPWLALDTEFAREKTYYPVLCLLQLCNGELAACIDPLNLTDLTPLLEILADPKVMKIFHAGRQDLEIFYHRWSSLPQPLFDTQIAAGLLGLGDQIGYAALVQQLLGRELEKGHTRTDWSRRPLDPEQVRYALDDVIYLGEIHRLLAARLREQGREHWLQEEFRELADPATYAVDPDRMWQRIRGQQQLKGVQRAVLQALAAWRETTAEHANRPRRWLLKDEVLLELARRQPVDTQGLERIRGLEEGTIRRWGSELLQRIAAAKALPKEQWPPAETRGPRLTPQQEAITDLLMSCLRLTAEREGVVPSALTNRRELERLVTGERDLPILHGWRRAIAGGVLLEVLAGRSELYLENGRLTLRTIGD